MNRYKTAAGRLPGLLCAGLTMAIAAQVAIGQPRHRRYRGRADRRGDRQVCNRLHNWRLMEVAEPAASS